MTLLAETIHLHRKHEAVLEITAEAPLDWTEFLNRSASCIFHTPEWVEVVARGYKAKSLYLCLREDGIIKTAAAGIVYDFFFFRMFFSNMPYGGLIGDLSQPEAFFALIEKKLKARGIHQIRLTQTVDNSYETPASYSEKKAFQHLLDLRGFSKDSLWRGYRKNTRRDIQKARKSGIQIREIRGAEELQDYYKLYGQTMRRNAGLCYYTKQLYQELESQFVRGKKAAILFAEYKGNPIAGVLLLYSHDRTYLIGNVSDPRYLKFCPNDLLNHTALEDALDRGLSYFDFMTSEFQDEPLMRFKEKWGAFRLPFSIYQKNLSARRCWVWEKLWAMARSYGRFFVNRYDS